MNYSVKFFDGKKWREWSLSHPANIKIGTPMEIFFDCVKSIVSSNNCALIIPILYLRVYRAGFNSPPDYDEYYKPYRKPKK